MPFELSHLFFPTTMQSYHPACLAHDSAHVARLETALGNNSASLSELKIESITRFSDGLHAERADVYAGSLCIS